LAYFAGPAVAGMGMEIWNGNGDSNCIAVPSTSTWTAKLKRFFGLCQLEFWAWVGGSRVLEFWGSGALVS